MCRVLSDIPESPTSALSFKVVWLAARRRDLHLRAGPRPQKQLMLRARWAALLLSGLCNWQRPCLLLAIPRPQALLHLRLASGVAGLEPRPSNELTSLISSANDWLVGPNLAELSVAMPCFLVDLVDFRCLTAARRHTHTNASMGKALTAASRAANPISGCS
eukprot:scaffold16452_cov46-Prasinocladus_malaysianus.AAC.2